MSKHTKGPWKTKVIGEGIREAVEVQIRYNSPTSPGLDGIIGFVGGFGTTQEENKANAYLMAAAPEMFSVLKQIEHECNGDGTFPLMGFVLDAIAKAEGKE